MTQKLVLTLYSITAIAYAVVILLAPGFLMPLVWNDPPGPNAYLLLQGWGAGILGFGVMAWLARSLDSAPARRVIVTGILVYFAGAVISWVIDSFSRGWTVFGAISFATYFLFGLAFIYTTYLRPES